MSKDKNADDFIRSMKKETFKLIENMKDRGYGREIDEKKAELNIARDRVDVMLDNLLPPMLVVVAQAEVLQLQGEIIDLLEAANLSINRENLQLRGL